MGQGARATSSDDLGHRGAPREAHEPLSRSACDAGQVALCVKVVKRSKDDEPCARVRGMLERGNWRPARRPSADSGAGVDVQRQALRVERRRLPRRSPASTRARSDVRALYHDREEIFRTARASRAVLSRGWVSFETRRVCDDAPGDDGDGGDVRRYADRRGRGRGVRHAVRDDLVAR